MLIVPAKGPGNSTGWVRDDRVPINEDIVYRMIHIDEDRYSGAYSGSPFTAWPGVRPDPIDAGDMNCNEFWREHATAMHGRGATPQEAYRDLIRQIEDNGRWDPDVTLRVILIEDFHEGPTALVYDSPEFHSWLENGMTDADLNIPPTTDPIAQRAYDLAEQVNEAIRAACAGMSALRWRTIAEQEAERLVNPDLWEFLWVEPIGHPPRIAITQYKGT